MMLQRLGGYVLTAIVAGVCVLLLMKQQRHTSAGVRGDEELVARVTALEGAVASARTRVVSLKQQERVAAPSVASDRVAPTEDGAKSLRRSDIRSNKEFAEAYEARFAAEVPDPVWAKGAERDYGSVIRAKLPEASRVLALECRNDSCRLEVVHDSTDDSNGFLTHLFMAEFDGPFSKTTGGFQAMTPTPTEDGRVKSVVFIAKPGASLALDPSDPRPSTGDSSAQPL
jgi:hypothetical protein